ncbi:hypothetical protein H112_04348 [Trichophyton rubrum D6]|uniref:Uncharacterized protein n=2 Tax=Trichophyton TaxID=5550 RepID=A0A022W2G3_TRIRU|nr:hypothetical protein H102_04340 [Trichophyton rubrum CBS 100081]EZF52615.1 hypothetical protein H103_04350 [Trichophyton rubrum CBS 288.86]EZF63312.1 hypothetical protein H104_04338 [Trichophyton rubrum CBS 289.86]EZF73848.1 hypothetical protein H105_04365 [Trichophyton soudanense CBS 452.61]EZF95331.1 hypothetical protein H113_04383 [Trichophyton rubrum MR1459]EZG06404.1 hypothetical protein H106_04167 [Trichophyton rubrum CBS 735.88]KDB33719.1 hypothetical protein H112_04348 [Trichophyto
MEKCRITRHAADQSTTRAFTILGRRGVRKSADRLRGRVTRKRQLFDSLLSAGRIDALLKDRNPFLFPEDLQPVELNPPAETSSLCRLLLLRKASKPLPLGLLPPLLLLRRPGGAVKQPPATAPASPTPSSPSSSASPPSRSSTTAAMPVGRVAVDRHVLRVESLCKSNISHINPTMFVIPKNEIRKMI